MGHFNGANNSTYGANNLIIGLFLVTINCDIEHENHRISLKVLKLTSSKRLVVMITLSEEITF